MFQQTTTPNNLDFIKHYFRIQMETSPKANTTILPHQHPRNIFRNIL